MTILKQYILSRSKLNHCQIFLFLSKYISYNLTIKHVIMIFEWSIFVANIFHLKTDKILFFKMNRNLMVSIGNKKN